MDIFAELLNKKAYLHSESIEGSEGDYIEWFKKYVHGDERVDDAFI